MNVDARFQAINQWSCALACVVWNLSKQQPPLDFTQDHLIHTYWPYFPKWIHQPGILERGDILRILDYIPFTYRRFLQTNKRNEFFDFYTKNQSAYRMGFLVTRKDGIGPLNHCLAIINFDGDMVHVMDPARFYPEIKSFPWSTVETQFDADILALFA